ncbi:glycosyltransferase family 4 protein [Paraflavitalea sp. CAU 1676]|uniref:glycosyltransferase family 4 protein n=1 Tax=Paraflavitalea sp. CAU 1676 TaxID=3032598 RepID=UPI0023DA9E3E|nr:glycosyltransferase family 4 protein [Paraflavitalea sp. CAU 1676]MDF2188774.1 glycosyltransferase family 4 protein [Paraflavitalea sp. CAU 1676]
MTKIVSLVTYQILPARTGGQRSIALFNTYLSRYLPLICVSTRNNSPEAAEGFRMFNIMPDGAARYANPFFFFTLRNLLRKEQASHVLLEHPYYGWMAVLLKWFCGVRLIVRSQNIEGLRWRTLGKSWWKLLWYYERWVHRRADHNFFIQTDDLQYAVAHFGLQPARCSLVTYGIETPGIPAAGEKADGRAYLQRTHQIPPEHAILLFNGSFNYQPNLQALHRILHTIVPALKGLPDFPFTLVVCGKDIPAELSNGVDPQVVFAGFVERVDLYFKGADVFLNPVNEGGGIKTKLVEALSFNTNAVSTKSGAIGVDPALCNGKLLVTPDDLDGFVEAVVLAAGNRADVPPAFFRHFYWDDIARDAAAVINKQTT